MWSYLTPFQVIYESAKKYKTPEVTWSNPLDEVIWSNVESWHIYEGFILRNNAIIAAENSAFDKSVYGDFYGNQY
jgi:hypothetical protein